MKLQVSQKCGTDATLMKLSLQDVSGTTLYSDLDETKVLGFYTPFDGYILHIVDLDVHSKDWMEDLSQVEKFQMSDEAYDKLENSFRAFKKRMGGLKKNTTETLETEIKVDIKVGDRCQVDPGDKRGAVKYVGPVHHLKPGIWIGVCYDEPLGKNNGTLKGERFFTCDPIHGAFVRPTQVRVGDYPPLDEFPDEL